jgi:hypothetical protein
VQMDALTKEIEELTASNDVLRSAQQTAQMVLKRYNLTDAIPATVADPSSDDVRDIVASKTSAFAHERLTTEATQVPASIEAAGRTRGARRVTPATQVQQTSSGSDSKALVDSIIRLEAELTVKEKSSMQLCLRATEGMLATQSR